jgi:hypothetical protein
MLLPTSCCCMFNNNIPTCGYYTTAIMRTSTLASVGAVLHARYRDMRRVMLATCGKYCCCWWTHMHAVAHLVLLYVQQQHTHMRLLHNSHAMR